MNDQDTHAAIIKVLVSWMGFVLGYLTLQNVVLTATLIFTLLQIYVVVRKIMRGDK